MHCKKILPILLGLALCLMLLPTVGLAGFDVTPSGGTVENGFWGSLAWEFSDDNVLRFSGVGPMPDDPGLAYDWQPFARAVVRVVVEEGVTSIAAGAFNDFYAMESVSLPSTLLSIGDNAFAGCTSIESVEYPGTDAQWNAVAVGAGNDAVLFSHGEGVQGTDGSVSWTISNDGTLTVTGTGAVEPAGTGPSAGYGWSGYGEQVLRIVVGEGITSLGASAFADCVNAESAALPESLTAIGEAAFQNARALESVNIPVAVKSIGDWAFGNCAGLRAVTYAGTYEQWSAIKIGAYNHFLTFAVEGRVSGTAGGFTWELTGDGTLTVSGSGGLGYISDWDDLRGVVVQVALEEGITDIREGAFSGFDTLGAADLPSSLRSVEKGAFSGCDALQTLRYHGTEEDWAGVSVDKSDPILARVNISYLSIVTEETAADAAALLKGSKKQSFEAAELLQRLVGITPGDQVGKLEKAMSLHGETVDDLYAVIGMPTSSTYSTSCLFLGADDGLLYYDGFVVQTVRYENGVEVVYDAYAR